MKLYILLLVLFFLPLPPTYSQFSTCDIRGTTPTLPCNYCTLSPTITIGANSTLPPTPQTLSVGIYSTNLNLGTFSPSTTVATGPTAGPIKIGVEDGSPSTQVLAIGTSTSGGIYVATRPLAGLVNIGVDALPPSPSSQVITIGDYSATLRLGRFANSIIMGTSPTAPSIIIGATTPTPTPTTIQNVNICPWCSTLSMGAGNTGGVTIATGPTAGPVTIGSPTGNPTQVVSVGVGTVVRISNTNTPGGVVVGNEIPSPSPTFVQDGVYSRYGRNVYLADGAQSLAVSYLSTAGPVTIGSPTANPGQGVVIAQASASLSIAENLVGDLAIALGTTPNIYLGRHFKGSASQNINIGEVFVTPTPTPSGQTIYMGLYSGAVNVATGSTAGPVAISTTSNTASITIGMSVPTGSPSPSQLQEAYLFEYSRNVRIAQKIPGQLQLGTDANSGVLIANGPTAGPITLGRTTPAGAPSASGSNLVKLQGLYHYFYNSMCFGLNTGSPATLNCNYANVRSNAGGGGSGTVSGYNTAENRWYPPEPGHYMITVMGLIRPGVFGALYIFTSIDTVVQAQAYARTTNSADFQTITAVTIQTFNTVGSGDYIEIQGQGMWDDGGASGYNVLSITRVA
jgi:hypothetical protein